MASDLNIDLGEISGVPGAAQDLELMRYATRANVACGGHAGHRDRMELICSAAFEIGTIVGAHPGYNDKGQFGRRELGLTAAGLTEQAITQVSLLMEVAESRNVAVEHVKPHGAMYHRLARDAEAATMFCSRIGAMVPGITVIGPPRSALLDAAQRSGLPTLVEGFADRAYTAPGQLADRKRHGAVLAPAAAAAQAQALGTGSAFRTVDGAAITLEVQTICVHGDGDNAVPTAHAVAAALGLRRR